LELQSDFVATVSHELRTPLASIRVQAETLQQRFARLPEARDYPARIVADVDGLSFLVDNILSFNRLNKGVWRPVHDDVSLAELTAWLRGELSSSTQKKVTVSLEGAEGVYVRADPDLIKLLLLNLGKNACLYNRRDPVLIGIRALDTTGRKLRFSDNGIGIPREQWENVFEEFQRIGEMTGARGTGLGLAICRRIMAAHGGSVGVVKSGTEGTEFELVFDATAERPGR
jgi:signal transduction histidine kinase